MKKTWKHINLEQRKLISSGIAHNDRLIEIAERLELDPRSISKEVRRNRVPIDYIKECISKCPNLNRWPLVCTKCKLRYSKDCCYTKFKYDTRTAQRKAEANLINSRKGIDLDSEEFKKLDSIIKCGIKENKSIYQIKTYEPLIP
ncbi:MAG: helix-turn-helix domain-containing protein [Mollicutes bacterium]|nr:helix-turn-helix domain-containing protein [Mollicutes bacterium]